MKHLTKLLVFAVLAFFGTGCMSSADIGEEGFLFNSYGKGIKGDVIYSATTTSHLPWEDMITYDVKEQSSFYEIKIYWYRN